MIGYANLPGNRQDWITLVKKDMPDNQYSEWFFADGKTSGTVTFKPLPAGEYELRSYHDCPSGRYNVQQRRRIVIKDAASSAADSTAPVRPPSAAPSMR